MGSCKSSRHGNNKGRTYFHQMYRRPPLEVILLLYDVMPSMTEKYFRGERGAF